MRFAKIVFWIAGIYGILVITPLYFIAERIGQQDPPPITHPGFYYGFVGTALAWQIAFLVIATNPVQLRLLMVPAVLEKLSFGIAMIVLYGQHRVHSADLAFGGIDLLFAVLFLIAFSKTRRQTVSAKANSQKPELSWGAIGRQQLVQPNAHAQAWAFLL